MAPTPPDTSKHAAKELACVDCQRRKKKCDKQSPCSNCVRHNVQCVPSSPAPPRKRRQPMKELLERLAACEERLKMCRCHENGQAAQGQQPMSEHLDATHDHAHHHYPPSPPASAASRDAAIANVLDYGDEMEQRNAARYSEHYV